MAPADPSEADRREFLARNGVTPMNRSTRYWDIEITAHKLIPHRVERVGSLDMARAQLDEQARGHVIEPLLWNGSEGMATGRAYDFCYCIEASRPDDETIDGRTQCVCQCKDCKPKSKTEKPRHWRKRRDESQIHAVSSKRRWDTYYYERKWRIRIWRRIQLVIEWWQGELDELELAEVVDEPGPGTGEFDLVDPEADTPPMTDSEYPTVDLAEEDEGLWDEEEPDTWDEGPEAFRNID
jgi:hypothetical protein